jgi:hypothetical protein
MDDDAFDALIRRLGAAPSRRAALRTLVAGAALFGHPAARAGAQGWCAGAGMWCTPLSPCCVGECFSIVGAFGGVCVDPASLAATTDGTDEDGPTKRQRRKQKRRTKRRRKNGRDGGGGVATAAACGSVGASCDTSLGDLPCCVGSACDASGVCAAMG